jgi:hypothetical protein
MRFSVQSERFLWDLRRTIADLVAESYYGALGEFAHANKLGLYAEAHPSEWEPIGAASRGMLTVAYRRRGP